MKKKSMGFAICGSFCTFSRILREIETLCGTYDLSPILSESSAGTDTRFSKAEPFLQQVESLTGKKAITTITEAEPIGPGGFLDVLVVAPCTGNTLAKLAQGIADTSVTMACKAQLRNQRPVVLAISTNDGLSGNGPNIGALLNRKHCYFVPFTQDDPIQKPNSLVADFSKIAATAEAAIEGRQIQPLII